VTQEPIFAAIATNLSKSFDNPAPLSRAAAPLSSLLSLPALKRS
jgi:hypothetical protein